MAFGRARRHHRDAVEVVVFASTCGRCAATTLRPDAIVLVKGRVDRRDEGKTKLLALEVTPFEAVPDQARSCGCASTPASSPPAFVDELKTLIGEYPGQAPVVLEVQYRRRGAQMLRLGPGYRVRPARRLLREVRVLAARRQLV